MVQDYYARKHKTRKSCDPQKHMNQFPSMEIDATQAQSPPSPQCQLTMKWRALRCSTTRNLVQGLQRSIFTAIYCVDYMLEHGTDLITSGRISFAEPNEGCGGDTICPLTKPGQATIIILLCLQMRNEQNRIFPTLRFSFSVVPIWIPSFIHAIIWALQMLWSSSSSPFPSDLRYLTVIGSGNLWACPLLSWSNDLLPIPPPFLSFAVSYKRVYPSISILFILGLMIGRRIFQSSICSVISSFFFS